MNIYEAIEVAYTILVTAVFAVEVIYFCVKKLGNIWPLIARGQAEESLDLERSESIKESWRRYFKEAQTREAGSSFTPHSDRMEMRTTDY